jgi:hypothetical protein
MSLDIKGFTPEELKLAFESIPSLPKQEQLELHQMLSALEEMNKVKQRQNNFLDFIKHVYPNYIIGEHHRKLAQLFEDIANGKKKRIIVNIAPRHGKSELISYLAPAWFLGKHPHKKVIMASHTADLAVNFGRRVRNLVGSQKHTKIFFQKLCCNRILNRLRDGVLIIMVSILPLVLAALLLDGAQIYLSSTILTQNKMQNLENLMYSSLRGNGFNRVPYNGLCLEEPLLSL